jgi:hypothetical protein
MVVPFLEDVGPNEKWQCLHDHIFTCGNLTQIHPEKKRLVSSETPLSSPSSVVLSYICNCLYVHSGKNIVNLGNSSLASNYVMFSSSKNLPFFLNNLSLAQNKWKL